MRYKVGQKVYGYFTAPWDEEELIRVDGTIVKEYGRLWFRGDKDNEFDDFASEYKHLKLVQ